MVRLTRLTGVPFALNPDLIERVEETPDTVITLVDGTKYLVRESLAEVIEVIVEFRARLLAAAGALESASTAKAERSSARRNRLSAVPGAEDAPGAAPLKER